MKYKMDPTAVPSAKEHLDMMAIRAREVERLVYDLQAFGEPYQKESGLIELANRHLLNALEVLKGIKFGRA